MIMAAPKPAKPRTVPAMQATAAQIRKGKANRSGMRAKLGRRNHFLPTRRVGRWPKAGGVMGDLDDAHDPSARCAGTSPRFAQGGEEDHAQALALPGRDPSII